MKPQNDYRNGDGGASTTSHEEDSDGEEGNVAEEELSLHDDRAPARALAALNALRKSRQHYDVLLLAAGAPAAVEVPAHIAVLAAASPYLLEELASSGTGTVPAYRVEGVESDALQALVEYAYTGHLMVRDASSARRLYRAAWRLRLEPVRAHLAERLVRLVSPGDCLQLRALPDLDAHHLHQIDAYIAQNFEEVCTSGALNSLPAIRIEMLRESSAHDGEETPQAVAAAALAWLRAQHDDTLDLADLSSRTHLLYVDGGGALRDCGELPVARGDAPELKEYRREAAERVVRRREMGGAGAAKGRTQAPLPGLELGARNLRPGECGVVAARRAGGGRATRALFAVRGRLAVAHVSWCGAAAQPDSSVARGAPLGGARDGPEGGMIRAELLHARCAHGTVVCEGRLVVCGGYDRARVLRAAEAYDPSSNTWTALPDMRVARARFPAVQLGGAVLALGGSDGHAELDTVDALEGGKWRAHTRLPLARSHAAAVVDDERRELYVVGGWAAGHSLKRVHKYSLDDATWTEAPSLNTGRSQCAGVLWEGALWALGGCDAWHCLASTETLPLGASNGPPALWTPGPSLPTARRSVGGAVWRGRLVSAGGSDGAASLRRTDWLEGGVWRPGPQLRRARADLGLAVLGDVLYAVGGFSGKEFLSCVECLYEPAGEWTTLCSAPAPPSPLVPKPQSQVLTDNGLDTKETNGVSSCDQLQ